MSQFVENNSNSDESNKFPTVGLKSLLQNSELLELLLKPISNPKTDNEVPNVNTHNDHNNLINKTSPNLNQVVDLSDLSIQTDKLDSKLIPLEDWESEEYIQSNSIRSDFYSKFIPPFLAYLSFLSSIPII
jgi:hypothetical protein